MTALLIWARAFHFGSGLMLVGIMAFRWLVLRPGMTRGNDGDRGELSSFCRRLQTLFAGAFVVLILSGMALLWAVTAGMSGSSLREALDGGMWGTVLGQTRFGMVFLWRAGMAGGLLLLLWPLCRRPWQARAWAAWLDGIVSALVTALLVSLSWTGHASAGGSAIVWRIGADAVHLFTAAIWPTGLLFLAMFLGAVHREKEPVASSIVISVVERFSVVSLIAVFVLAGTGTINACYIVGSFPAMVTTEYGQVLDLKLILFVVMLGIASWNRYRLLPLLFHAEEPLVFSLLLQRLRGFVFLEFGLAVAVLCLVALLGTMPPPR